MAADLQAHNVWKIHSFLSANPTKQNLQNSDKNSKKTIMYIVKFLSLIAKIFLINYAPFSPSKNTMDINMYEWT